MINKIKPAIFFLIPVLFLQGISGQVPTNMNEYLSKKFLSYTSSHPREEIYIHSDRNEYLSGEDLWFNVYLLNRQSFKPSSHSKIAYVELLNPENRPVVQKMIWLDGGFGPGQFVLPDSLSTGTYTIRAYTNWMKNFLPNNCFIRNIHIYNAFSNKSFKARQNTGKILNSRDINSGFSSYQDAGVKLKTDNLKPDILDIFFTADENYRFQNNNIFYLFIQTHGIINRISSERITGNETKISIPKMNLSAGVNQITVFNLQGKPVGERFVYTPEKKDSFISLHSPDSSGTRKKVTFDFELPGQLNNNPDSSGFSVSVVPGTNSNSFADIADYMIFGTEFEYPEGSTVTGIIPEEVPANYIDSLLLTVRSNWINWNSVLTVDEPVLRFQPETADHFISGKLFKADHKTAAPNAFVVMSAPGKIAGFQYARTDEEGNFSFKVHIDENVSDIILQPNDISENQFINMSSSFSDQYLKSEMSVDSANGKVPGYISNWSVNHQVRKIYTISSVGDRLQRSFPKPKLKRFYGKPSIELIMKDYILLPVMQEVFFELLPGVFLKSKKSGYEITINDPVLSTVYDVAPGLFVDGVMVKDPSVIAALDPEIVEKIEVKKEKYFVGDYLFYGIVNVITKAGDFSSVTLPDYAIRQPYRAIDPVSTFVSPDYSSAEAKKSRIPDFRNTLYWNPTVKPDKTGKARVEFWSSDVVSDFEIIVQGISSEGKPFSLRKSIKIKK
jgi:hypothetical protein